MFESEGEKHHDPMGWAASLNRDEELPKFGEQLSNQKTKAP
jgi:hypothetical protein